MSEDNLYTNSKFLMGGLLMGILIGAGTVLIFNIFAPPTIQKVEWNYPVMPFHFTELDPPDSALHYSTEKTATGAGVFAYYEVYIWKVQFFDNASFYWTYRLVTTP